MMLAEYLRYMTLHFLKGPPRLQEINYSNVVKDELDNFFFFFFFLMGNTSTLSKQVIKLHSCHAYMHDLSG